MEQCDADIKQLTHKRKLAEVGRHEHRKWLRDCALTELRERENLTVIPKIKPYRSEYAHKFDERVKKALEQIPK